MYHDCKQLASSGRGYASRSLFTQRRRSITRVKCMLCAWKTMLGQGCVCCNSTHSTLNRYTIMPSRKTSHEQAMHQSHTIASASFSFKGWSCHVNMQPHMLVGEPFRQVVTNELSSAGHLSVGATLDTVLHVSNSAGKLVGEKFRAPHQRVDKIAALLANKHSGLLGGFVRTNNCRMLLPCCYTLCPCQGAHVEQQVRVKGLCSVSYSIPQDKTAFSIGVVDFHSLARVQKVNIIRAGGFGADSILSNGQQTVQLVSKAALNNSHKSVEDRTGSTHVSLHAWHVRLAFDAQASSIIHDTLASQSHGLLSIGWFVLQNHQSRRVNCSLADTKDTAKSLLLKLISHDLFNRHVW
eukprot:m.151341 g.151341  ORF g.151341 m.151341 type:complete len:352 (+) comp16336_c0_seq1:1673-2728(+)